MTRAIAPEAIAKLRKHAIVEVWPRATPPPYAQLVRRAREADALLTMVTDRIDAALIASAPKLRVISNLAVGLDNIDVAAATAAGIAVGHTPGVLTDATADLAFALLMAAARRIAEGDREVRAGKWQTWGPSVLLGRDVWGATLGIIGWGQIGRAMARRGVGFNMRVLYVSRSTQVTPDGSGCDARFDEAAAARIGLRFASCAADAARRSILSARRNWPR